MPPFDIARRRDRILSLLSSYGALSAEALADMLAVTVQTVRSDLRTLDEARVIRRRHGSASLCPSPGEDTAHAGENLGYQPRRALSRAEKARIGMAAARLIPNGASVALGTGTTVEAVARALAGHRGLRVATNNIHAVLAISRAPGLEISVAGGRLRQRDLDFIGAESVEFFAPLRVDFAIFSVGGVSQTGELLDFNMDEVRARRAITACARHRMLVTDHAKIGRIAGYSHGSLSDAETVICGAPLPDEMAATARAGGCTIIVA